MVLASALCRPCRCHLLRQSRDTFKSAVAKNSSRQAPTRFNHQIRCEQATATTPAGLTTLPWTDTAEQQQALKQLQDKMSHCAYGQSDEETQKWFLRDRKLEVEEAAQKLTNMLKWRQEFKADAISWDMVKQEAATGKGYLHKHKDVHGRPVIVIKSALHKTGEFPLDDSKRLCVLILEDALKQLPEGQETVLGIFDLQGFNNKNSDLGFVRFLVDIFFTYYPKRLGQVLFVDAPWIFQPGWSIVKPWLGKYAGLVAFVKRKELQQQYFTPETVPDDFKDN